MILLRSLVLILLCIKIGGANVQNVAAVDGKQIENYNSARKAILVLNNGTEASLLCDNGSNRCIMDPIAENKKIGSFWNSVKQKSFTTLKIQKFTIMADIFLLKIYRLMGRFYQFFYLISHLIFFKGQGVSVGSTGGLYYKYWFAGCPHPALLDKEQIAKIMYESTGQFKKYNPFDEGYFLMISENKMHCGSLFFGPDISIWSESLEFLKYIGYYDVSSFL